jgi:hypothetical protein
MPDIINLAHYIDNEIIKYKYNNNITNINSNINNDNNYNK